jgi:hypothetical protein
MHNPFKRKPKPYEAERQRLMEYAATLDPTSDDYSKVLQRIDQVDRILNRTSELKKTLIPALGTIGALTGIYMLQQFAGILIPKAVETYSVRQELKTLEKD